MSGEWGCEGCGSSHLGALRAACWQALVRWDGGAEANGEMVWRDGCAGAGLGGCAGAAQE